jgi:glycosyltransferase involved in cell wall biosynthesis
MSRLRVQVDASPLLLTHPTGVSQFCLGLLSGLAKNPSIDVSAFVMARRRGEELGAVVPSGSGVRQFGVPVRLLDWTWHHVDWPPLEWFLGRAEVIHGTNFVVPPSSRAVRVVTVHDLTPVKFRELCDPRSLRFREAVQRAVARGAWVHTPSEFVAGEVIDTFHAEPEMVKAIWPGIPDLSLSNPRPRIPTGPPRQLPVGYGRYILAVGTIEPRKDYPTLVAAFDRIAGDHPDVALVIAGSPGWGSDAFDEAVAMARHRDRIIRLGYVADRAMWSWLAGSTVLAYPSRYEGFGLPPVLAMSAGVPVVATRAGAVPEVVGDAALLVPIGDADALAAALATVLDAPDLSATLVAAGRSRAEAFSWERCLSAMVDLYQVAAQRAQTAHRSGEN